MQKAIYYPLLLILDCLPFFLLEQPSQNPHSIAPITVAAALATHVPTPPLPLRATQVPIPTKPGVRLLDMACPAEWLDFRCLTLVRALSLYLPGGAGKLNLYSPA